jgi:8-oxo-dGTP pyrophosphatase MutT (NUDIX family)
MIRDAAQSWPVASSVELASGQLVRVRRDKVQMPDGSLASREIVEHPGAVAVLALDDDARVLLIRQYRHPVGRLLWEIPAGLRDVAGEPLLVTAQRELAEETGYRAADWRVLIDFYTSPGFSNEKLRIFLARALTEVPAADRAFVPEHEEAHLVVQWVPLSEAVAGLLSGELHNGVTAVGVLAAHAARGTSFAGLREAAAPET